MLDKLKSPCINSKLKGMYAKRLTSEDLEDLLRQSDLKSAVNILKMKFEDLQWINENIDRIELEQALDNIYIYDIKKIDNYLGDKEKYIFKQFISKYEIECVKNVYRNLNPSTRRQDLTEVENWIKNIFTDLNGLTKVQNLEQFTDILKNKKYLKIIKEELENNDNKNISKVFAIESKLDKYYFKTMYEIAKDNSKSLLDVIGQEIDLLNVLWIYRTKHYFNLDYDKTKAILIDVAYKLNKNTINKLINANDYQEMQEILKNTKYKNVFDMNLKDLEKNIKVYLYNLNKKYFLAGQFNISTIFCYMNLKEYEKSNIINIIEGIRYNISKEELVKKIIV